MPMPPTRDREAFKGLPLVNLRCPRCSKRLGQVFPTDSPGRGRKLDGVFAAGVDRTLLFQGKRRASDDLSYQVLDWVALRCPKCDLSWQGRDGPLAELARRAHELGQQSFDLPR